MMGNKKLSTIRTEVAEALARSGLEPEEWFENQLRQLEQAPRPNEGEINTLLLLRDALAKASKKPRRRARSRSR